MLYPCTSINCPSNDTVESDGTIGSFVAAPTRFAANVNRFCQIFPLGQFFKISYKFWATISKFLFRWVIFNYFANGQILKNNLASVHTACSLDDIAARAQFETWSRIERFPRKDISMKKFEAFSTFCQQTRFIKLYFQMYFGAYRWIIPVKKCHNNVSCTFVTAFVNKYVSFSNIWQMYNAAIF